MRVFQFLKNEKQNAELDFYRIWQRSDTLLEPYHIEVYRGRNKAEFKQNAISGIMMMKE